MNTTYLFLRGEYRGSEAPAHFPAAIVRLIDSCNDCVCHLINNSCQ